MVGVPGLKDYKIHDPRRTYWRVDDSGIYMVVGGKPCKVASHLVVANGTRDICLVDKDGCLMVSTLDDPVGRVVDVPSHDIAVFIFHEPLPDPYRGSTLILEVDQELEPLIRDIHGRWTGLRGKDYDAHLGGEYWRRRG